MAGKQRLRDPRLLVVLLALLSAFALLGSRGIWDPDEGRYTNVALTMLDRGDWIEPRRSEDTGHWTKPPLTYWAVAASAATFGRTPWAVRLPGALSFLLCTWLAWRIARRLMPGTELSAAAIYATMPVTVGASQLVTTDVLLSASVAMAAWGFIEARFVDAHASSPTRSRRWIALMWAGLALGVLTKGPPALLLLPALLLFDALMPSPRTHRVFDVAGVLIFALLALPWYVAVVVDNPGLFRYFAHDEVVNRITTNEFGRHGEWYGWLEIYLPTLLFGTLPWTPALLRWARALPAAAHRWRDHDVRALESADVLLALWALLPLLVFCLAQSRMPLYILPVFLPLAIIVARQRQREGRDLPRIRWLLAWALLLVALKLGLALWPTHKDASRWAEAIRARVDAPVREVVFVEDMARYGLHLHLGTEVNKVSLLPPAAPQRRFNPQFDDDLAGALATHGRGVVWVCRQWQWPAVQARITALGHRARSLGVPHRQRVIFVVEPSEPILPASSQGRSD